uniref:Uncharacterized protein n=1 Tax=Candidatus Kentrum sp. LFY TaxID=2126342 RepID=A0A450WDE0_9GAMM|nr:MAG: hypothetical protein BECKLFY1418C_GA0070996_101217 [Candidatus Kentron sp. LFY]
MESKIKEIEQIIPAGDWFMESTSDSQYRPSVFLPLACWARVRFEDGEVRVVGMIPRANSLGFAEDSENFGGYMHGFELKPMPKRSWWLHVTDSPDDPTQRMEDWEETISGWLDHEQPEEISVFDVLKDAVDVAPGDMDFVVSNRVADILEKLGWEKAGPGLYRQKSPHVANSRENPERLSEPKG